MEGTTLCLNIDLFLLFSPFLRSLVTPFYSLHQLPRLFLPDASLSSLMALESLLCKGVSKEGVLAEVLESAAQLGIKIEALVKDKGGAVGTEGGGEIAEKSIIAHPLLKTTLTGLRRTYLRFLFFRPKLTKTKRFPPFLDHMNGKLFLGGSRFWSGKIGPKLAVGGHQSQCPAELSFIFNRCPAGNPLFSTDKIFF